MFSTPGHLSDHDNFFHILIKHNRFNAILNFMIVITGINDRYECIKICHLMSRGSIDAI